MIIVRDAGRDVELEGIRNVSVSSAQTVCHIVLTITKCCREAV